MKKTLSLIGIFSAITAIVFVAGCSKENTVQIGDTVEVTYTATLPNGTIFKTNETGDTLRFVVGSGEVIAGLDEGVIDMKLNSTDVMSIAADKAYYKEYNPMKIQKVAKVVLDMAKITAIEGKKVKIGEAEGLVKGFEKDDQGYEYVLLDMNDPYTYETLTYKVTIKALEKSTNN